jgi:hypothetical protein
VCPQPRPADWWHRQKIGARTRAPQPSTFVS